MHDAAAGRCNRRRRRVRSQGARTPVALGGFAVETFPSGAEFLLSLPEHRPACLVLDLHMPDLSGLDVQLLIKRDGFAVPTVIITGHDTVEVRARVVARGASAYLRKPVDDKLLLAAIAEAIGEPGHGSQKHNELRST
jgi:FixJ family two-component response regulator